MSGHCNRHEHYAREGSRPTSGPAQNDTDATATARCHNPFWPRSCARVVVLSGINHASTLQKASEVSGQPTSGPEQTNTDAMPAAAGCCQEPVMPRHCKNAKTHMHPATGADLKRQTKPVVPRLCKRHERRMHQKRRHPITRAAQCRGERGKG